MSCRISGGLAVCASLWLAACGGLSDVGEQDNDDAPPTADAVVLNQPFTTDSTGKVSTRVRSGTEVFLSGKDSDGVVAPVLKFDWQLLTQGTAASQVKLVTRSASTISFTAPTVPQDTPLQFRLTVTDSNGKTAQKDVDVTVVAIPDADHFLAYDLDSPTSRKISLVAIASRDITAAELEQIGDVEFEITVQRLVDYTTPGVDGPYLPLATERFRGKWLADFGVGSACDDPRNPVFQLTKPSVDIDDILAAVDPAQLALKPNPALVDKFELKVQVSINVVGALPGGAQAQVCAPEVPTPAAAATTKWGSAAAVHHAVQTSSSGLLELNLDQLLGDASGTLDTRASARAYYDTIDPDDKRTTFIDWLKENGFVARDRNSFAWTDLEAASTAHAIYTNNYDLGFGRDMYARVLSCSDGAVPTLGQPLDVSRVGNCDIAAVVVNYSSLEAATKKLNPVLAVAMEYTITSLSEGRRIVQFYTFAPDLATGRFERVLSANLDGRGEKYMPQVCTVCHGGAPGGMEDGAYKNAGDVGASFLPWDLDAFLFADAEGANSDKSYTDQSQRSRYTRAAQAESLRKLNQLAYLTYEDANRFALARELVEGWYGFQSGPPVRAFANTAFDGQFTPAGWSANGADGAPGSGDENPASAQRIYHDVFARNCRACHVAQVVPDFSADETLCKQLTPAAGVVRPAVTSQLAIACYRQFVAEPALASRIGNAEMPFARLTMDRFWVTQASGVSPANDLLTHLAQLDPPIVAAAPGEPRADFNFETTLDADHPDIDVGSAIRLAVDPAKTKFADTLQWAVEHCLVPGAPCTAVTVAGASSPGAHFAVPDIGTYNLSLAAASLSGRTAPAVVKTFSVAAQNPEIDTDQLPGTLQLGGAMDVRPTVTLGNGGRESHRYWVAFGNLRFAANSPTCDSEANACTLNQTVRLEAVPTFPANAGLSVFLKDANGPTIVRNRAVELTSGLSPTTTAISTDPNRDEPINFAEGVTAPAGEQIEVQILSGPSATNALGSAQLLPPGGPTDLVRTYRPPPRYANYDVGGTRRGAVEQIGFRLIRRRLIDNVVVEQRDFTREIRIEATTSFASNVINQVLRRTTPYPSGEQACTNCHAGAAPSAGFGFDIADQLLFNAVSSRVSLGAPASSRIVCWPSQTCQPPQTHGGADRDPGTAGGTNDDMAPIRAWIEEGANNF